MVEFSGERGSVEAVVNGLNIVEVGETQIYCDAGVHNVSKINFLNMSFVPERTCINTAANKDDFCCSECTAYAKGAMVDDFDCWVSVGNAFSRCPSCGAKVEVS